MGKIKLGGIIDGTAEPPFPEGHPLALKVLFVMDGNETSEDIYSRYKLGKENSKIDVEKTVDNRTS